MIQRLKKSCVIILLVHHSCFVMQALISDIKTITVIFALIKQAWLKLLHSADSKKTGHVMTDFDNKRLIPLHAVLKLINVDQFCLQSDM